MVGFAWAWFTILLLKILKSQWNYIPSQFRTIFIMEKMIVFASVVLLEHHGQSENTEIIVLNGQKRGRKIYQHSLTPQPNRTQMSRNLPTIGRRSVSGLSVKQLGEGPYRNRLRILKGETKKPRPQWTGLSDKNLGHTPYQRLYRKMVKQKLEGID
jgi:hypothetical protein